MGVRLYAPILGRFLQTDPVPGGSANDYDYTAQDPLNKTDLDGRCWGWGCGAIIHAAHKATHAVSSGASWAWHHKVLIAVQATWFIPGAEEFAAEEDAAEIADAVGAAAAARRATAARRLAAWDRGTFENRTRSMLYHYAKHGGGRTLGRYLDDAADWQSVGRAAGRYRGSPGGIVGHTSRLLSFW